LLFGESGLVIYQSNGIPDKLDIQVWVIESDNDVREFATDADTVLENEAFKGLVGTLKVASAVTNPILSGIISVGGVVTQLLRKKLLANKDDLVGYWQASLNREEHYPHGARDRQNVPDTTGNVLIDYTLFGFENVVVSKPEDEEELSAESTKAIKEEEKPEESIKPEEPIKSEEPEPESKEDLQEMSGERSFVKQIYPAAKRLYETADGLHPLFVTAQAALETGWKIKKEGNNIFGITKGSWKGATNLLLTTEILNTPDKQFKLPEKVVSVDQLPSGKYRYSVYRLFRVYSSLDESLDDHLALLKGSLYRYAWEYRHDPREYARQIAPVYATAPSYADTLIAVINMVERNVREINES
jgi:flagellar protein FlgJ